MAANRRVEIPRKRNVTPVRNVGIHAADLELVTAKGGLTLRTGSVKLNTAAEKGLPDEKEELR